MLFYQSIFLANYQPSIEIFSLDRLITYLIIRRAELRELAGCHSNCIHIYLDHVFLSLDGTAHLSFILGLND